MHAKVRHSIAAVLLAVCPLLAPAQPGDVKATLTPLAERVEVGRPFEVELSVRHPPDLVVIFPDSARDFTPYEVHSGKPIPTHTENGVSEDVKLYKLYTWEIDSVQYLQFPVRYLTEKGDTGIVLTNRAEVLFQPKIARYSDSLKVRMIAELAEIGEPFNWLAFGIIAGAVVLVLGGGILLLWKPVRRMILRWRINREWRTYQAQLAKLRGEMARPEQFLSGLNRIWKRYFDRSYRLHLAARTTPELQDFLPRMESLGAGDRERLLELSRAADMVLYAGRPAEQESLKQFFSEVHRIMTNEYRRRKKEVEL